MNIKEQLLKEYSKKQTLKIAEYIGNNQKRFDELMQLFFNGESRVNQRASWVFQFVVEKHPHLIKPYFTQLVEKLYEKGVNDSTKRNTVRLFQFCELPNEIHGKLTGICFQFLANQKEAIAIRVFSMTVLERFCKIYPDLKTELKLLIEENYEKGSAGFKSRGRKVLKSIS